MKYIFLLLIVCFSVSCSFQDTEDGENIHQTETPVKTQDKASELIQVGGENPETARPNTSFEPTFVGQTRITGIETQTPYEITLVQENLGKPWGITQLPDFSLLIAEKSGIFLLLSNTGELLHQIESPFGVDERGQGGLLDVTLDSNFIENSLVYWTFSERVSGGNLLSVAKGTLSRDRTSIDDAKVILQAGPAYDGDKHFGSRLVFDPAGNLFVSTGERSDTRIRTSAQDTESYLGKILHITPEGKPVSASGNLDGYPEIYSFGHRNPQGLAYDTTSNTLWSAEMGPRGGDELNLIQAGINYGWPIITYGEEYSTRKVGDGIAQKEGMQQPVYYWDPSVSPSGIDFYSGSLSEWQGNLFLGALSGQKIIRLQLTEQKIVGEEWLFTELGERFRDILSGRDGFLYTITDSGKLYRVGEKK